MPSERELAQLFDVSRVPVREALKILAFMGVIEYVKGKGSFVKRLSMSNMLENIDFLLMSPLHTMVDLFEAREAIELQATRLAAQRRSEEDIYAIKAVIAEMESNIKMGIDVYDASMKFHSAIIAASHNTVLVKINEFLADC